ncbi:MAG TPA: hypothetical protein VFZ70_01080 [Euzebyales bacterium]
MNSEPLDRDRFYRRSDRNALAGYVEDEAVRVHTRDGLVRALSRSLAELERATDPRDVASLETEVMALRRTLDVACARGGAA